MSTYRPGNNIFHYCKLSTALEFILPGQQLRLGPIVNTNDPRENKSHVLNFAHTTWGDLAGEHHWTNAEISEILKEDCKVLCFSQNHKADNDASPVHRFFGYELSRMWAYYGGNHHGLCLELDKEAFLKENEKIIDSNLFRDLKYEEFDFTWHKNIDFDQRMANSIGVKKYLKEVIRPDHLDHLFFTKNKEWESEHELRLIHFSDTKDDEFCSIKSSLRNVFCGVDFNLSYLPSLIHLCPDVNVSILKYKSGRLSAITIFAGKENFVNPEYKRFIQSSQ